MITQRELRRRVRTVQSIERIVTALQRIAAARLMRERTQAAALAPYADALDRIAAALASVEHEPAHPLVTGTGTARDLALVIVADRGLCGSYNANVVTVAAGFARRGRPCEFIVLGRRAPNLHAVSGGTARQENRPLPAHFVPGDADLLARQILESYRTGAVGRVFLIYTPFRSVQRNTPVARQLLPAPSPGRTGFRAAPGLFEPTPAAVLDAVLTHYVTSAVGRAIVESSASENAARMLTMEQAAANARDMIDSLALEANKLRQATITRELSDIVGTAEALT